MENKTSNYYSNINRLVRFFERTKSGYAFGVLEHQGEMRYINDNLQFLLHDRNIFTRIVNFDLTSPLTLIEQLKQLKPQKKMTFIVNNLGDLIRSTNETRDYLLELNFAREELYTLQAPILFWLSQSAIGVVSNRAADLYSQRSINTLYFEKTKEEDSKPLTELQDRFNQEFHSKQEYEELEIKIKLQKRQLDDAEQGDYPQEKIAKEYALPLAKTYSELDIHDKAFNILNKYQEYIDKHNATTQQTIADIYFNAKKYNVAILYYKEAFLLSEKNSYSYQQYYICIQLADIYFEIGEYENCQMELEKSLDLCKQNKDRQNISVVYERLGRLYQSLGDFDKALQFFELGNILSKELFEANPKSENLKNGLAISYEKLGDIYKSLGDFDKALQFYELRNILSKELFEANPKSENLKFGLAISYEKLGSLYLELDNELESKNNYKQVFKFFSILEQENPKNINNQSNYAESIAIMSLFNLKNNRDYKEEKENLNNPIKTWQQLYKLTKRKYYLKKINIIENYLNNTIDYKKAILELSKE